MRITALVVAVGCILFTTVSAAETPSEDRNSGAHGGSQSPQNQPNRPALPNDLRKRLGELIERDWKDRPEWATMTTALLKGDPIGPGTGWFGPAKTRYDWQWLQKHFDRDGDGRVSKSELPDSPTYFARLDRDGSGSVTQSDLDWSKPSRSSGLASEFFLSLDIDSNGRVSREEYDHFFEHADSDGRSFLTSDDLARALTNPFASQPEDNEQPEAAPSSRDAIDFLQMLLTEQLGVLDSGPELDAEAPDFALSKHDDGKLVRLSDEQGKRPVVLIFGSFT